MHNPNDGDRDLQALFQDNSREFDAEPFVGVTLKRIERQRSYRKLAGILLRLLAVGGVITISPALIRASTWLSDNLGKLFEFGGDVLAKPTGTLLAILLVIAVLLANARGSVQKIFRR